MLTKMAISAVVSLKMLKVRIFTEFFYQCTSLRSFLFLFFEMSHLKNFEMVTYFGPSSQNTISQQIFFVIMHLKFLYFQKVFGLI